MCLTMERNMALLVMLHVLEFGTIGHAMQQKNFTFISARQTKLSDSVTPYDTITAPSGISCCITCSQHVKCKSVSYNRMNYKCHLNSETPNATNKANHTEYTLYWPEGGAAPTVGQSVTPPTTTTTDATITALPTTTTQPAATTTTAMEPTTTTKPTTTTASPTSTTTVEPQDDCTAEKRAQCNLIADAECYANQCKCKPGYYASTGSPTLTCHKVTITLGSTQCTYHPECSAQIANAICDGGQCRCPAGYTPGPTTCTAGTEAPPAVPAR